MLLIFIGSMESHKAFHQTKHIFLLLHLYIYIPYDGRDVTSVVKLLPQLCCTHRRLMLCLVQHISDIHMGQQSLFYRHEHLQQPAKLTLDLWPWTCACTGCFPEIQISLLSVYGKMLHNECIPYALYLSFPCVADNLC